MLSFDGTAQDISRQKGSFKHIVSIIEKLLKCPHIDLEINSVFTPKTVTYLSESIQFIVELGVPKVNFTLSKNFKWDSSALFHFKKEMALLREFLLTSYKGTETIPLTRFRNGSAKGVFTCVAGSDRMAITPDGKLWGCHVFSDFFLGKEELKEYQKYCFGDLDTFIKNYKAKYFDIIGNYLFLRMDYFYTPDESCLDCASLESCRECPIIAAYSSKKIGKIPITACKINKIIREEKRLFWKELESYNRDRMYSH
jgi:radical SAM protein with 4Fe4S-binding SPASM domain